MRYLGETIGILLIIAFLMVIFEPEQTGEAVGSFLKSVGAAREGVEQ